MYLFYLIHYQILITMLFQLLLLLALLQSVQSIDTVQFENTVQDEKSVFYMRQYKSLIIKRIDYDTVSLIPGTYCNIIDAFSRKNKWYLYHSISQDRLVIILLFPTSLRIQSYKWLYAFPKDGFVLLV